MDATLPGLLTALAWLTVCLASRQTPPLAPALNTGIFLAGTALAWGMFLWMLARLSRRGASAPLRHLWAWAILFRLIGLLAIPLAGEDDWHRYLWDGHQTTLTGQPYADTPADHFNDPGLPPILQDHLDHINSPGLPTIYGPAAQLAFALAALIAPGQLWAWKLILITADLLAAHLLVRLAPNPVARLTALWCPLSIAETSFQAHPEALGLLALAAALHLVQRQKFITTGLALALAVCVKPLALLPATLILAQNPRKLTTLLPALTLGILLLHAPFHQQAPSSLLTFAQHWEFNAYLPALLRTLNTPPLPARILCATLLAAATLLAIHRRRPLHTLPAFILLTPVLNPWYLLWWLPHITTTTDPRPPALPLALLAATSLSYLHGGNLPALGLPPYALPWWLRPLQILTTLTLAHLIHQTCREKPTITHPR